MSKNIKIEKAEAATLLQVQRKDEAIAKLLRQGVTPNGSDYRPPSGVMTAP